MDILIIGLVLFSALCLRAWTLGSGVLASTGFLVSWTLSASLIAYGLTGTLTTALVAWILGAPCALLALWAFAPCRPSAEPAQGRTEPPRAPRWVEEDTTVQWLSRRDSNWLLE